MATCDLRQPGRSSHYDEKMAGPAWDDEVASERADANLARLAVEIPSASNESRSLPTANLARTWHREMLDGVEVPDDAYRGGFRGDAHPALIDYEVTVGGLSTARACDVSKEISQLMTELERRVSNLDDADAQADPSILTPDFVEEVLGTAAWLHSEWVRVHPFANGNGRTARMWVLWLCGRYGLPPLLALRPRPDMGYNAASQLGVTGDHNLLLQYLLYRYNTAPHLMYDRR
jgi:fido (protein-threonine AMPylation protein)